MPDPEKGMAKAIIRAGWKGECPRCSEGRMFQSWLRISDTCEFCGLDYRFATPDDGPAFFSLCFVAFPLLFVLVWFQVTFDPSPLAFHIVAMPLMGLGCVLPLRPIKGWLVASQYHNRAVEAGTERLWSKLNDREDEKKRNGS